MTAIITLSALGIYLGIAVGIGRQHAPEREREALRRSITQPRERV